MAMPHLVERYWTADDVRALPDDGNRYECIDGALLVTPAPRYVHQYAVGEMYALLLSYVALERVGSILHAPADVELDAHSLVQPDIFVARGVDPTRRVAGPLEIAVMELVVEVLSPSTRVRDRTVKREFYLRSGVEEYWIVDNDARCIERWRAGTVTPEMCTERLVWQPAGATAALGIDVIAYFSRFLDA
jgi:Uma2 family endonuclease